MSKVLLEPGDKIKRYEVTREIDYVYEISEVTKTIAKTKCGERFKRELIYNVTKPLEHYVAEIYLAGKKVSWSTPRYFLIKEKIE